MIDIVNGLRRIAEEGYRFAGDAADEIERLRASLEAAEKERDAIAQQLVRSEVSKRGISEAHEVVTRRLSSLAGENIALQAKIAEMEKQSPICRIKDIRRAHYMTKVVGLDPEAWLYALPGAQTQGEGK